MLFVFFLFDFRIRTIKTITPSNSASAIAPPTIAYTIESPLICSLTTSIDIGDIVDESPSLAIDDDLDCIVDVVVVSVVGVGIGIVVVGDGVVISLIVIAAVVDRDVDVVAFVVCTVVVVVVVAVFVVVVVVVVGGLTTQHSSNGFID